MKTLDLLDALEDGIRALRSPNGLAAAAHADSIAPASLRGEMARAALSVIELSSVLGLPRHELDAWLNGRAPIPAWVPVLIRVMALLPPAARPRLLSRRVSNAAGQPAGRSHPFSRIEEL